MIDDYLIKEETKASSEAEVTPDSKEESKAPSEEAEYEVENIITYKKMGVSVCCYLLQHDFCSFTKRLG